MYGSIYAVMYCKWLKALFKKSQYAHNSTPIDWHSPVIHLFHVSVAHPWTSPVEDAFSRQELTVLGVGHHPSQMHRKITAQSFATIVITSIHHHRDLSYQASKILVNFRWG